MGDDGCLGRRRRPGRELDDAGIIWTRLGIGAFVEGEQGRVPRQAEALGNDLRQLGVGDHEPNGDGTGE